MNLSFFSSWTLSSTSAFGYELTRRDNQKLHVFALV
jgi:hypothetical protein